MADTKATLLLTSNGRPPSSTSMTFLDFAARGKNQFWRYLVAWPLGIVFTTVLITGVLLPGVLLHWLPPGFVTDLQSPGSHPLTFYLGGLLLSFGCFLLGFAGAIYLLHRKTPVDLAGQWSWSQAARGAGLWLIFILIVTGIDVLLRPGGYRLTVSSLTPTIVVTAIIGVAVQTFCEEFIFRGYLTQGLLLWLKNPLLVSILSGAAFGAMHIPNGIPSAVGATAFGIVMAMVAIRTGGLAIGYGIHFINNLFGCLIVVSEDDVFRGLPAVWTQHTPELVWTDTLLEYIALAVVLWLLLRTRWLTPADRYPK